MAFARKLNLDLTHAQVHYGRFLRNYVSPGMRWLEVGCGRQVIPEYAMPLEEQRAWMSGATLIGVDVDSAMLQHPLLGGRVIALGGSLPFVPECFDLVSSNMVVEHVSDPQAFLADIHRVLKPGGRYVFHTPNYHHYLVFLASFVPDWLKGRVVRALERRIEEDRFETHYRLNTAGAIRRLALESGFEVEAVLTKGSNGYFSRLGPLGVMECLLLKAEATLAGGRFNPNLMVCLRKPG